MVGRLRTTIVLLQAAALFAPLAQLVAQGGGQSHGELLQDVAGLVQAGRFEDAVEVVRDPASADPQLAEQVAQMMFSYAYQFGHSRDDHALTLRAMVAAKKIPNISPRLMYQLNFWHGWSLYQTAVVEQEPQTPLTAQATLPKFKEAVSLLQHSGDYPTSLGLNVNELVANTTTYIEIQEAIIRRGG